MRHTLRSLVHAYKRFGQFSTKEWIQAFITALVFGFIFSFTKWGKGSDFVMWMGLYNWGMYALFSLLAILAMQFGTRFMAIEMGYEPSYKSWKLGLFANVFICFLTNGGAIFLSPGGYDIKINHGMQLGKFSRGILVRERAYLVFWGFFSLIVYTLLIKIIFAPTFAAEVISVAYSIALWSLFPADILVRIYYKDCPVSNGSCLFFARPWHFSIFTILFLIISAILSLKLTWFWPLIVALLISYLVYLIYYIFIDPKVYK